MKCDIGHFEIKAEGRCYSLIPSFENIMKLGDGEELIDAYNVLHGLNDTPNNKLAAYEYYMYMISLSAKVIRACCKGSVTNIITDVIEIKDNLKLKKTANNKISPDQQIIVAGGLLRHGISGINKSKKKSSDSKPATTVDLWGFVNVSRVHLGMDREEALSLTMTEFNNMMDAKFPPETNSADFITDEEYDESMARLAEINKIRDAK